MKLRALLAVLPLFALSAPAAPPPGPGIMLGAFIPATWEYDEDILAFDEATGRSHTHVMIFCAFDYNFEGGPFLLDKVGRTGKSPIICWQSGVEGVPDERFSNISFINGGHDDGIIAMAQQVRNFVRKYPALPVYIRWAHEANIKPAPAWPGHPWNNGSIEEYVGMFRHVHDLFYAQLSPEEAGRVVWTWSVNYFGSAEGLETYSNWKNLYPGDAYVDMTGLSGLNYGDHPTAGPGFSVTVQWLYLPILRDMMAGDYRRDRAGGASPAELARVSGGKPQGIFEFGSVDARRRGEGRGAMPGAFSDIPKEDWITQGYDALAHTGEFGFVRLVVMYNDIATSGGYLCDFRVSRNPNRAGEGPVPGSVTQAYRDAIRDSRYLDTLLPLEDIQPGDFYHAGSIPAPASHPQHEFWLSPPPGGTIRRGSTVTAAFFLYPPAGGAGKADAYVAARIPTGEFYAFVYPAGWRRFDPSRGGRPPAAARGVNIVREVQATAFIQPMGGGVPAGTYTLYSILVPPGADPLKLGPDLRTTDFSLVE
ncbi:MAG: hypothetical protein WCP22_06295 [Chlamydiota bacterium]